jgi:class 3 adenylate cyclase
MADPQPTADPARHWWHHATLLLPLACLLSGVLVLADALLRHGPLWLITGPTIVLVAIGVTLERFAPELQVGRLNMRGSSAAIPLLIAACTLVPAKAALVALLVGLTTRRSDYSPSLGTHLTSAVARAGTCAIVSWVFHTLAPVNAEANDLLPLAVLGAVILQAFRAITTTIIVEYRHPGEGRTYLDGIARLIAMDAVLPVVGMSIALNFAPDPIPLDVGSIFDPSSRPEGAEPLPIIIAMVAFAACSWFVLRVLLSERALQERSRHLRDAFSRYVPESLIEQLDRDGAAIELGGEEREITVLFCDIRGFTSWSEQLPPTQVVEELNVLLAELTTRVFEAGGSLDKYTGDGLMAFWGAPVEQPDHARRAFLAALTMVEGLCQFNLEREAAGKPPFRLGVGLHTGRAVVGNIGHAARHDYTAIGDTVNLSARLEAATKEVREQLLISQATWEALPEHLRALCTTRGNLTVKGRVEPVHVLTVNEHEALGLASGSFALDAEDAAA